MKIFLCLICFAFFAEASAVKPDEPIIQIEDTVIVFEAFYGGKNIDKQIKVTNAGTRELRISNVRGSCGLMVTAFPRQDIAPGESGIISFRYDTSRLGEFERNITIHSNSEENTVKIIVKGIIKKK